MIEMDDCKIFRQMQLHASLWRIVYSFYLSYSMTLIFIYMKVGVFLWWIACNLPWIPFLLSIFPLIINWNFWFKEFNYPQTYTFFDIKLLNTHTLFYIDFREKGHKMLSTLHQNGKIRSISGWQRIKKKLLFQVYSTPEQPTNTLPCVFRLLDCQFTIACNQIDR